MAGGIRPAKVRAVSPASLEMAISALPLPTLDAEHCVAQALVSTRPEKSNVQRLSQY